MMLQIIYSERALKELSESFIWYQNQQIGLGDRFQEEINLKLDFITNHPNSFPIKKGSMREILLNDFPFSVTYTYNTVESVVLITSIFHNKRNPKKKFKH
jgi:plasmid stabilization system protein ParE